MNDRPKNTEPPASAKQALLALKQMQARLEASEQAAREPIAIVGIGCRLPGGAASPQALWDLLRNGVDAISELPSERRGPDAAKRWGGFLTQVDQFDPYFFGITPREAASMDPQQRLLLEVAWEALEDAGQTVEQLAGTLTGVFVGVYNSDYLLLQTADPDRISSFTSTGTIHTIIANRLSYFLDLRGPSLAVDTACSSSLVAVHLACQSLRHRECNLAVAGGVNLMLSPLSTISTAKLLTMAADGRAKTFDARADGMVRSEGCGVVILKRVSDAIADGDPIWAVIAGSAINQDGRTNVLTAPNGPSQQALMRQALANARGRPEQIGYIETHGTGTPLGDPIEVEALAAVYGEPRGGGRCVLGAIKTNLGHLEAAAGIAGLIKAAMCVKHGEIPLNLHFTSLNPHISIENTRFVIPTRLLTWDDEQRFAAVSSFGVGGSNAHLILRNMESDQAANRRPVSLQGSDPISPRSYLLPISARSTEALKALAVSYRDLLQNETPLHDIAYTASVRRSHHEHRLALAGRTCGDMIAGLDAFLRAEPHPAVAVGRKPPAGAPGLVFVFPGQGSQWLGMGRGLMEQEPVFRQSIERCDLAMRPYIDWSLVTELSAGESESQLARIDVVQPLLFALQVSLAALWRSWGIEPDALIGHSMGEVAAAQVAGALELDDAARIICLRSRLLGQLSGKGAMVAAELSLDQAKAAIAGVEDRVSIAVSNGPRDTVLAGDRNALEQLVAGLEQREIFCRWVKVDVAAHSPQIEPLRGELLRMLGTIKAKPPATPMISTVKAGLLGGEALDAAYWVQNLREPVFFWPALQRLIAEGHALFVELSPHPVLLTAIDAGLRHLGKSGLTVPSLRREVDEREVILSSLGALYANGCPVEWRRLFQDRGECVRLPAYPWQRERFWLEPPRSKRRSTSQYALLGERCESSMVAGKTAWQIDLGNSTLPYLADHRVQNTTVFPAAGYLEMVLASGAPPRLKQVRFHQMLALPESSQGQTVELVLSQSAFQISSRAADGWTLHASGAIAAATEAAPSERPQLPAGLRRVSGHAHYQTMQLAGLEYGAGFRGVQQLWYGDDDAFAEIALPATAAEGTGRYAMHPVLLDSCFQVLSSIPLQPAAAARSYVPVELAEFQLHRRPHPGSRLLCHARMNKVGADSFEGDLDVWDDSQLVMIVRGFRAEALEKSAGKDETDDYFYRVEWHAAGFAANGDRGETPAGPSSHHAWLILSDGGGLAERLRARLESAGEHCICARSDNADLQRLLQDGPYRGVVCVSPDCAGVLAVVQGLVHTGWRDLPRLWLVASGVHETPLCGLGRTIRLEHPELRCTNMDLSADEVELLFEELRSGSEEDEIQLRGGARYVARLAPYAFAAYPFRLEASAPGVLDHLTFAAAVRRRPDPGEVEIQVCAAGLNFLDVLRALGVYPGQQRGDSIGSECAGRITAVGEGVDDLQLGDEVVAIAPGSFASFVTTRAAFVMPKPKQLNFEQAATLPLAFMTAVYALHHVGRLAPGERLLIHTASGGVGLAAIQVARAAGAEIFATAGSAEKRDFLRALGVSHVMDSRTLAFADDVLQSTGGRGVDAVLNTLTGEAMTKSLEVLAPYGRFLDLSKRDIHDGSHLDLAPFRHSLSYAAIDLARMLEDRPELIARLLRDVVEKADAGIFQPLPLQVFPIREAVGAFRTMAQAAHIGKIVIAVEQPSALPAKRFEGTYLVTGGLGGLGLTVARWLTMQGVTHLVLLGRRSPSAAAGKAIEEMRQAGADVRVKQADVGNETQLAGVLTEIQESMPALRGVIHAAAVLDDGMLLQLTPDRFRAVMKSKIDGAWNLHRLTADQQLDCFVMFSSVASILGSPGQGNYAAANSFLDGLAHYRRERGLPALSINWGPWAEIGLAAAQANRGERLAFRGLASMAPDHALSALDRLMRQEAPQVAVMSFNLRQWQQFYPKAAARPFFRLVAPQTRDRSAPSSDLPQTLREKEPRERLTMLQGFVREQVAQVLHMPPSRIEPDVPLRMLGIDSLMVVELRNRLEAGLGLTLSATLVWKYPTIVALASHLAQRFEPAEAAPIVTAVEPPAELDPAADKAQQLKSLSDDEMAALLAAKLAALSTRGRVGG